MIPYIHIETINVGPVPLHPFGILVALGVIVGCSLGIRRARQVGLDETQMRSFMGWTLVAGFMAAHILDAILYHPREVVKDPWLLLELWNGLSSFGGFLGGVLGALAWKHCEMREAFRIGQLFRIVRPARRLKPVPILPFADTIMAVLPVGWVFGRAGCAIVHDHPGTLAPAGSWLAVAYGPGPVERFGPLELRFGVEPRWDLGLLEMLFAVVLVASFAVTWRRCRASGWYSVAACILYAPSRFVLDFLRIEEGTGADPRYAGFTPAQWACGALLLFGLGLAWRLSARVERRDQAVPSDAEL